MCQVLCLTQLLLERQYCGCVNALDGVALVVQQAAHAAQHGDVLRPVEPPAAGPLHRADEGELGFPEAQHVLRHAQLVGRFGDRPKGFRALGHGLGGLTGQRAVDPRLHHLGGAEADHPARLDGGRLAGLGIAAHAGALGADLEDAEAGQLHLSRRAPAPRRISSSMRSTRSAQSWRVRPTSSWTASHRSARVSVCALHHRPAPGSATHRS